MGVPCGWVMGWTGCPRWLGRVVDDAPNRKIGNALHVCDPAAAWIGVAVATEVA